MEKPQAPPPRRLIIAATVSAVPLSLAVETVLRPLIMPAELLAELPRSLGQALTTMSWILVVGTAVVGAVGTLLIVPLSRRAVARAETGAVSEQTARLGAFLLVASASQLPALLATLSFLFGASAVPVIGAVAVSTVAVGVQAYRYQRSAVGAGSSP